MRYTNEEFLIFVYAADELWERYGQIIKDNSDLFGVRYITFNRIKNNFRCGKRREAACEEVIEGLNSMFTVD